MTTASPSLTFARLAAEAVTTAHAANPASWVLSHRQDGAFSLTIGRIVVLREAPDGSGEIALDDARLPLSSDAFDAGTPFPSAPEVSLHGLPPGGLGHLITTPGCPEAYAAAVARALETAVRNPYAAHHSTDATAAVGQVAGVALPTPDYGQPTTLAGRDSLDDLLSRFIKEFAATEVGWQHLAWYPRQRAEARASFDDLRARRAVGGDVTSDVLARLLPHANTRHNRDRHAWIAVCPAVTRDIKEWFEGARWTRAEDWSAVADSILEFGARALQAPESIDDHCRWFAGLKHTKGLQSGIMSPLLNALAPDALAIVNSKSQEVASYFTGDRFSSGLTQYAEVNRALARLAEMAGPGLGVPGAPDAEPGDVFDMFCHWLVAIERHPLTRQQYWKVSPGPGGEDWAAQREGGYIGIGWDALGDVSGMSRDEFRAHAAEVAKDHPDYNPRGCEQAVWRFAQFEEGATIIANAGTGRVLGIGTVSGPYYFAAGQPYPHRLSVDWSDTGPFDVSQPGWKSTVIRLQTRTVMSLLERRVHASPATPLGAPDTVAGFRWRHLVNQTLSGWAEVVGNS